jgi:hypothetical protein
MFIILYLLSCIAVGGLAGWYLEPLWKAILAGQIYAIGTWLALTHFGVL